MLSRCRLLKTHRINSQMDVSLVSWSCHLDLWESNQVCCPSGLQLARSRDLKGAILKCDMGVLRVYGPSMCLERIYQVDVVALFVGVENRV